MDKNKLIKDIKIKIEYMTAKIRQTKVGTRQVEIVYTNDSILSDTDILKLIESDYYMICFAKNISVKYIQIPYSLAEVLKPSGFNAGVEISITRK